jgi:hypothetical protein
MALTSQQLIANDSDTLKMTACALQAAPPGSPAVKVTALLRQNRSSQDLPHSDIMGRQDIEAKKHPKAVNHTIYCLRRSLFRNHVTRRANKAGTPIIFDMLAICSMTPCSYGVNIGDLQATAHPVSPIQCTRECHRSSGITNPRGQVIFFILLDNYNDAAVNLSTVVVGL